MFACVVVAVGSIASPAAATIKNVGGGTWSYDQGGVWDKNNYSDYVHNSKYHSATSICGSNNNKVYANAHSWANSKAHCGFGDDMAEYWNTY